MIRSRFLAFPILLTALAASAAENWPGWRGPTGDGISNDPNVPVSWTLEEDTIWKVAVPGIGHASPIIWEDRIYTVTAIEETGERNLLCLDRKTGSTIWKTIVLEAPFEGIHKLNSRASSTPVTDGERIFVSFLDKNRMFVAAYDLKGEKIWEARAGEFSSKHGYCSSPILWKDTVIVNGDHDGDGFIVAFDQKSGEEVWNQPRPNNTRSYCTPLIRKIGDRNQMIMSGSKCVASYDPDTGKQHWIIDGPTEQYVASLVYNENLKLLFMTCGFPERHMMAIDPTGEGNVTDSHVRWHETVGASYVPSPIAIGPYFLVVADNGVASCFVAETGEKLWRERLVTTGRGGHSASLISANGLAYFVSDGGVMTVVKPGKELDIVAQNELGEKMSASPVVYDGKLYLRGHEHLFCIGSK
ncbi:MAG: outer membrane protein assembly factor BamB [Verrucomicrobiales bacterium]|jgi:outer membrane protein assembly factor BamB